MTFKKLVTAISKIRSAEDCNILRGQIDRAFDLEKINWADHERLYNIVDMIDAQPAWLTDPEE